MDVADQDRVCRACGSTSLTHLYDAMTPGFEILACGACGAQRTWPEVPDDEIGKWYPQAYYGESNVRFNPVMEKMTMWFARQRAQHLARGRAPGRVLDVGCGRGTLLAGLQQLGWSAHGVELSEHAAVAARKHGIDVFVGPLSASPFEKSSFDLIVFWHTLEHFRRPDEALTFARTLLKPDGSLVVAVPNADSLQATVFGPKWFHYDVPRHYHHMGPRALDRLLQRTGFVRQGGIHHLNLEQNPYGVLQSMMNRVGFEENFLYSMVKTKSARTARLNPGAVLGNLALLPGAAPASLAFALIEAGLGRGGTIEVVASPV
jgi:2-polyprenyl-3-methyl-5-hydroxy-6-metoxy-1,4-benzoquinol methylase